MIGWNSHSRFAGTILTILLIAGAAAAVVLVAGQPRFPSSPPEPPRADEPPEARPIAADLVTAIRNADVPAIRKLPNNGAEVSRQQRQHWLGEQALLWSGLPVVTVRPTMFLESFVPLAGPTVRDRGRIELPFGRGRTNPVAAADVARVVAAVLADPGPGVRAHRPAVAGHVRGRPGVLGRTEPRGHVL